MSQATRTRVSGIRQTQAPPQPTRSTSSVEMREVDVIKRRTKKKILDDDILETPSSAEEPPLDLADFVEVLEQGIKERQRKNRLLRGLCFYIFFITTLLVIIMMQRNVLGAYWMNQALSEALFDEELPGTITPNYKKNFYEVHSVPEIYDWLDGVLLPVLESSRSPNGSTLDVTEWGVVAGINKVVGGIRMRQLRVTPVDCSQMSWQLKATFNGTCYPDYTEENQDRSSFGPGGKYKWTSDKDSDAIRVWGRQDSKLAGYGGDGYIVDLPHPSVGPGWHDVINELRDDNWLAPATRALIITVNLYNPNVNIYDLIHIVFEQDGGGGVNGFPQYKTYKLDLYVTAADYFRFGLEMLFALMLCYFVWQELDELYCLYDRAVGITSLGPYFRSGWNALDILNIALFATMIGMQASYFLDPTRLSLDFTTTAYVPLEKLAIAYTSIFNVTSFNVLLSFLKVFKYLQFNTHMLMLWRTLDRAKYDLFLFLMFFFIVIVGFAMMGNLLFGPELWGYHDVSSAVSSTLRMALGELDYVPLANVNRSLAPVFTLLFVVLVFFVLINIFLAIINDAYSVIHAEAKKEQTSFLDDVTRENFSRLWARIRGRDVSMSNKKIVKKLQDLKSTTEGLPSGPDALKVAVDKICVGEFDTPKEKERIRRILESELKLVPPKRRKQDLRDLRRRKLEFALKMYSFSDIERYMWYINNMELDLETTSLPSVPGGPPVGMTSVPQTPKYDDMMSPMHTPGRASISTPPPPPASADTHVIRSQLKELQGRLERFETKLDALIASRDVILPGAVRSSIP